MMKKIRKGFTLIEMVVVLFIISLLMLIMVPNIVAQKENADKKSDEAFKTTLTTQAETYLADHPEKTTVSADDLQKENYITAAQSKRAKKIKDLNFNSLVEKDKTDAS
ncbi:competence type IV pilus major pilin ComGC [Companilactobacillus farciminis]|uniref:competence type IV pilus major pilin ComGC n=1 Tax=Companilactobacillus farciminis TaxID=1612 RepID=UPI00232C7AE6|nr:competence type IV pilus major pilin ComGC [Companilactobacillus farciminis]WCG34948.1 competence type IV pilus major pilin ComGC [Companilactobacillus farciminis]